MGGAKKKSPAQQEKTQSTKTDTSKKKQDKEGALQKAEISVTLTEDQAMKTIKGAKVITVSELAKNAGVKLSAANTFLQDAQKKNLVKRVAGRSGHYIYQPSS